MKKLAVFLALLLTSGSVFAYDYPSYVKDGLKDEDSICSNQKTHKWTRTDEGSSTCFIKQMTHGSGGFSEFEYGNEHLETGKDGTTYEFLYNGDLIGYNAHTLKFYKLVFNGKTITSEILTVPQIQEIFPDVQIVNVSQFKNNKITLTKPWFQNKTYLIVNDTERDFYKYQFEKLGGYELIRGILNVSKYQVLPEKFVFSHFGARDKDTPPLYITVVNGK